MTQRITAVFVLCLFAYPSSGFAQATQVPVDHQQALTGSPLLGLAGFVVLEYERKISPSTTLGVVGAAYDFDAERYRTARMLFRYYPQGAALSGFFVGAQSGLYRFDDRPRVPSEVGVDAWDSSLGIGVDLGYNWLLGADRHFSIGLGLGLTRLFGRDAGESEYFPTGRFIHMGVAF
jgi:hypothetical protein